MTSGEKQGERSRTTKVDDDKRITAQNHGGPRRNTLAEAKDNVGFPPSWVLTASTAGWMSRVDLNVEKHN